MNIVVALDSFKGCMTSSEANEAVRKELENRHDDVKCQVFSVSDGGEGFLQAMQPDDIFTCCVHDAMMRPTQAQWGVKNNFAIIEVAQAIGLDKIEPDLRNPLLATSYGVGEMMMDALSKGFRNFIVGLGGSAVSDCGLGLMKCLKTMSVARDNGSMVNIDDLSWLRELTVILASDVDNPLLGPHGAAAVFAPQKGASADMIRKLERRASTFSRMAAQHTRLADAFTPLAKGINSEYANQTAYDAISIHGGSGFIMEYKCQRLYRDARIFSIYEGTTQLQVVAAIRYITNGTYLSIMKEMLEGELACDCMKALRDRVARLVELYEESIERVNAYDNQDIHDFLARRLYNMTADIIGSLLLIEDASKAPELFKKSANVFVRMAEEEVIGHASYIKSFDPADLANFKATDDEPAEA